MANGMIIISCVVVALVIAGLGLWVLLLLVDDFMKLKKAHRGLGGAAAGG
jgi:UDP-N-acetylmuramyl pentapeptide phosphotransferase/UDP-N-acetylglucosamine-1-phosphate transferase